MKCFHAVARDPGCRPHEILKLRLLSISFRFVGNRQYAEVGVNGKTGKRSLPLIDSLPYVKDYLDYEHPSFGLDTGLEPINIVRNKKEFGQNLINH